MTRQPLLLVPLRLEALVLALGAPALERERIGMGPVRAVGACARHSRSDSRRPLVLIGCAGGLDPTLRPGDVVVADSLCEAGRDGQVVLEGAEEVARLLRLVPQFDGRPGSSAVHVGPLASSARIVRGSEAQARARLGGAIAVDMEALWCAPLQRSRPFAVVRVVLDVPERDLFSFSTLGATIRCARALAAAGRALGAWHPDSVVDSTLMEVGEH